MRRLACLILPVILLIGWSILIEPGLAPRLRSESRAWRGAELKVVFFSDLHAGAPHIDAEYVDALVAKINGESPDLILIGGDLVTNGVVGGTPTDVGTLSRQLAQLRAPLGVFAVLGNHDWWHGAKEVEDALTSVGIHVLENESRLIERGERDRFWLLGIGDDYTGHGDAGRAFSGTDEVWPKIVFMHDPGSLFQIERRFHVAFAGHLHGGQVFVPGIGALVTPGRALRAWADGWTELELGPLYVSKGVGTSILPVRLNAPPELVVMRLRR